MTSLRLITPPRFEPPNLDSLSAAAPRALYEELLTRLASRISSSREEIVPYPTVPDAVDALSRAYLRGRRVVIARPARETLVSRAWRTSATAREAARIGVGRDATADFEGSPNFDLLLSAARDADTLVLTSPFLTKDGRVDALSPRELLRLRSRAPRPLILLDLLDEELARSPLTQAALLIPGTVILRGFGSRWREAGAGSVADLAFVAGPPETLAALPRGRFSEDAASAAVWDLDRPGIDRAVEAVAATLRLP